MSIFDTYQELLDILWYTDEYGNKISIQRTNQQFKIVHNKIILNEIPDSFHKVTINGKYEIDFKQSINSAEYFKVNYLTGEVFFHESLDGTTITINEFYAKGLLKIFAKRVVLQDENNNWDSDNIEDLAIEIKNYINSHISTLNTHTTKIQTNENNIASNLTKINKNITDIETNKQNHLNHLNSISAHKDDSISNTSTVAGGKVKDALNSLNTKDQQLNSRIDNIINQSGTSSTEVTDARNSAKYGTFASLDARLEEIETRSKYFARESKTVLTGANTITLTNLPENNHKLLIYDTKYGAIWEEVTHWNRSGATITFTSAMPEDLNFVVINLG